MSGESFPVVPAGSGRRRSLRSYLLLGAGLTVLASATIAPAYGNAVGDPVLNPVTNANEIIAEILPEGVITDQGNFILLITTVGAEFTDPEDPGEIVKIESVNTDPDNGNVVSVVLEDGRVLPVVQDISGLLGDPPDPAANLDLTPGAGNTNIFSRIGRGSGGSNGRTGALFVPATSGGNGATGPTQNYTIPAGHGDIETVSDNTPGISVVSIGGNGGRGGDGYAGASGRSGGTGGAGGPVTVVSEVSQITTSGSGSHGIFAQSRSGRGGQGGSGFIFSGGGSGGAGNDGGTVHVTSEGDITTLGDGAHGVFGQSLGGGAGSGGISIGLFGSGGGGAEGGSGGTVTVINHGNVVTAGAYSHGVFAQSVGGNGGSAGASFGLAAFGDNGEGGGNGGMATAVLRGSGSIITLGEGSIGLFAQSTGGGGGQGGTTGGALAMGSQGGSGGNGGQANATVDAGGYIQTQGDGAYAVAAQSIGGGGGMAGVAGGAVALGGGGSGGGSGGNIVVSMDGELRTLGEDASAIFAQSIGGGGGSARGTGGLFALGGTGGGGGAGGSVTVTTGSTAAMHTSGQGAHGIFAQSIGGGGGSGSSGGGVVSLGGSGAGGGNGAAVTVTHGGSILTEGNLARGIFAQSVGGGGGSGGHSGGLVSLGGSGGTASTGGNVTVTNNGIVETLGDNASAIQAQSIGGGGGDGGTTGGVFLTIGGGGGGGGGSGLVTVNHTGDLQTFGDDSHGIFAQSVGGGGGNGGASGSISAFAGVALGGAGGAGGAGGNVVANLTASGGVNPSITTHGDRSRGLYVQSVGGGGGNGGFAVQVSGGYAVAAGFAIGGSGGSGGAGGTVTVNGHVDITTFGQSAEGIMAQSVGGGGGSGGFAGAFAFSGGETAAGAFSLALGGSGGTGGAGGTVILDSGGQIITEGDFSTGLVAQSVGGGGGSGGFAISVAGSGAGAGSGAVAAGVGGSGGDGGAGGTVNATFDGEIYTIGDDAGGALIQSVGGGGGNGGFAISGAASISGSGGVGVGVGVGGSGGGGAAGGTVTGSITGPVYTDGERSTGVIIQSIGGGGGNGGFSVAGSIGGGGSFGGAISVGVGGSGGGGGAGGTVNASAGEIHTLGHDSGGFLAQSVGGGGGNGGFNVSGAIGGGGTFGGAGAIGIGGAGGDGGAGGNVTASVSGVVTTQGDRSAAVIAQSLGGGGGNGGFNVSAGIGAAGSYGGSLNIGVGGAGGGGGHAGNVTLSALDIFTSGDQSGGFLAQSVGGGGGSGGFNVAGGIGIGGTAGGAISVGVGGSGGGGGNAGNVTGTVTGDVVTQGDQSVAITAQSIGGGGGSGGFAVSGGIAGSGGGAAAINVGVGGSGGGGGHSGAVTLSVTGQTDTSGEQSSGIVAQSVGGGGGSGGFAITGGIAIAKGGAGTVGIAVGGSGGDGGNSGNVTLTVNSGAADPANTLAVVTRGDGASGVVAQSVGGGGGNGGFTVTGGISAAKSAAGNIGVGIGGGGGGGGDGGTVIANITGGVATWGDDASAVFVQSLGGGGGNGGFNVSGGIAGAKTASGNIMVGVGGFGGDGGHGGAVSGSVSGDVFTAGANSSGVTYQSLGGGGGNGGFNVTGGVSFAASGGFTGNLGVGVGGFGGAGGDASTVNASITGDIYTQGSQSYGALLQSLGGGGGNGAFNVTGGISAAKDASGVFGVGIGGFGGGGGDAAAVTGTLAGNVVTEGDGAYGVSLQSLGGGGGNGGFNVTGGISVSVSDNPSIVAGIGIGGFGGGGGDAGTVTGTITGDYQTSGNDAHGVLAQSVGGSGGNGGFNVTGALAFGTGTAGTGAIGIGGFGGAGGHGDDVTLVRAGLTRTHGLNSSGIIAQSIGGGGGNGGFNVAGGVSATTNDNAGSFGFGLGGFGGGGGNAGDVIASVTGSVIATGAEPGKVVTETVETVDANGETQSETLERLSRENGSHGVLAQSLGGGGGNGAFNVTGQVSVTRPGANDMAARAFAFGVGGFGGDGGDAGTVNLTIAGPGTERALIQSTGDDRFAVGAQSIGGGGGAGAFNISGGISSNGQIVAGVGGFGGDGGLGGNVTADVDADLFASGVSARGLLVQSVGGGGGFGGFNVAGGVSFDPNSTDSSLVAGLGGFGGAGNASGDVTAVHSGLIFVTGQLANGALVQSVAGGGGSGGWNVAANVLVGSNEADSNPARGYAFSVGVGGTGGDGADAGDVSFTSTGDIIINGAFVSSPGPDGDPLEGVEYSGFARGVLVQSIGGGGGSGGFNFAGAGTPAGNPIVVGVGGSGGSGGHGGDVSLVRGFVDAGSVNETAAPGLVRTFGDHSTAILVQSVGGGGGDAGINIAAAGVVRGTSEDNPVAALIAVGGSGAGAGSGGDVTVRHAGTIITDGEQSAGLIAQSIGGGGGNANFNVGFGLLRNANALNLAVGGATGAAGRGGDVTVSHDGAIVTVGDNAMALVAQSIGGGGGNTAMSMATGILTRNALSISIGRLGGTGGEGGDVNVDANGLFDTSGDLSTAIFAQSIGGGGGVSGSTSVGGSATSGSGDSTRSGQVAVAVGLEGGTGATAGHVAVTAAGQVTTRGLDAHGIHAQSIGGGGGAGGTVMNIVFRTTTSATVGVGGTGGTGGLGGDITVHSDALISTSGRGANGLLAQSIGGGGGTGGYAANLGFQVGGDANPESSPSVVVGVNVGGAGGTGNDGGEVDVSHTGMIFTTGEMAYGIRAQSIGGGGGDGGMVINARIHGPGDSHSADINVGGSGGVGGIGGDVTVDNEGLIVTEGRGAAGISANSIGGGGGNGALVLDGVFGVSPGGRTQRFVVNVGGFGGSGGTGGDVTVTNRQGAGEYSGMILTSGDDAYGIFAQSLGGGGGNGGSVLTMTGVVSGGDYSLTAGLNIGGFGGSGNTGGTVDVLNSGLVQTEGSGAHGILAQSIGGGGGNGGMVLAGNILIAKSVAPMFSLGGFGGDGGDGGDVTVTNSGQIFTSGANAHGIQAQSIGGGGGNANVAITAATEPGSLIVGNGFNALLGATLANGSGGTGGHVTVNHTGSITVTGTGSQAIRAESINGGGGSLVMDFTGITSLPGRPDPLNLILPDLPSGGQPGDPLIAARLGADEATDTNAGKVTINTTGQIASTGDHGAGSAIQAIGGGGGSALLIARLTSEALAGGAVPSDTDIASSVDTLVELGGSNGIGNSGADVDNIHNGAIITTGLNAPGSIIQSIGGGGGRATTALFAPAGTNLGPVRGILGGVNGTGEAGGDIAHTHNGELITTGDLSAGLILQSIGGGGGSAAFLVDGAGADGAVTGAIIGGEGGSDQDAGSILADLNGGIFTLGNSAPGLLAQSIGGGGGELRLSGFSSGELLLGGLSGSQGDGAGITISNTGAISTAGTGAHGVVLQSIGGGGGAVFGAPDVTLTLSDDNFGDGGDISFVQNGNIVTTGAGAYGVILQSLGGGGGWVDGVFAGSAGGNGVGGLIHVALSGAVLATGDDAVAVLLQSQGGTGAGGDITADFTGALRGGEGQGAGLIIDGGDQNTVNTSGSISAVSGRAIITTSGDDTINNDGLVAGNIDLGTGNNAFNNNAGATFVAFNRINLRSQADLSGTILAGAATSGAPGSGTFTNEGTFLMGLSAPRVPIDLAAGAVHDNLDDAGDPATNVLYGARVINTVELDGDFVQTENGLMRFDVAFGPYASDRVNVTGDALVNGSGEVILTWLENNDRVTLFATGGTGTDNGLSIDSTLAITYGIVADSAGIHLTIDTDFGQDFLNRNQRSLGGHMDSAVLSGGSSGVGRLLALLGNMQAGQEDAYQAVFNELNPEPHIAPLHGQIALARSFASDLFSCDTPGTAPDEQCVWTRAEMSGSRSAGDGEQFDTETDTVGFRGGLQRPLNERWSLAAGIGYESISGIRIDDNRARSEGQAVQFGLGLQRHTPEGLVLAGALSGGWQWLNSSRVVNVFDVGIGESSPDSGYARLDLSASQYLGAGNVFAIPSLGVAATVQRNSSFEETGLAGLGVRGLSETRAIAEMTPGLTLGAIFRPDERTSGVLTFSAQSVINSTGRIASPYMLLGANPSADPAIIGTAMDRQFWRLGTDFTISGDDRLSLRLRYSGEYGDRTESHRAGFELRARF